MKTKTFIVKTRNNFRVGTILTGHVEPELFDGGARLVVHTSNGVRWNLGLLTEMLVNLAEQPEI